MYQYILLSRIILQTAVSISLKNISSATTNCPLLLASGQPFATGAVETCFDLENLISSFDSFRPFGTLLMKQ